MNAPQPASSPPCPLPELPAVLDAVKAGRSAVASLFESALRLAGFADAQVLLDAEGEALAERDRGVEVRHGGRRLGTLRASGLNGVEQSRWAAALGAALDFCDHLATLRHEACTDSLTAAGNRRSFEAYIERSIRLAESKGRPLKLMLFDIDDFKTYNDRFGHAAGDEVLRETVSLLRSVIRRGDAVFRIGGDEFVVVFGDPDSPREEGSPPVLSVDQVAMRFSESIRTMHLPALGEGGLGRISVSAGMAGYPEDGRDPVTLLAAADRRALESKRRGKCTITFGPDA